MSISSVGSTSDGFDRGRSGQVVGGIAGRAEPIISQRPLAPIVRVRELEVGFDAKSVLKNLNLDIWPREIVGIIGGSGSGKSVLIRAILGLIPKRHGTIELFGCNVDLLSDDQRRTLDKRVGVLFQQGALFSSLTVKENVQLPMREFLSLSDELSNQLALLKIELVGLPVAAASKYPSELSGGMTKRAALARALALDPDLIILDEPTSGLDPISARQFDTLLSSIRGTLGLTAIMVTHDPESLHRVCDRVAVLRGGTVTATGTVRQMEQSDDPWIKDYFSGLPRSYPTSFS